MKKKITVALIIFFSTVTLPLFSVRNGNEAKTVNVVGKSIRENEKDGNIFRLKLSKSGKITEITAKEYVFGCVGSEMPISYDDEALKAQSIAAYTFACYKRENGNNEFDITDDYKTDQSYKSRKELKKIWGNNADEYEKKLDKIIDDTKNLKLTYNGKTALTVYHAISSGKTFSAKEVWGSEIAYLVSVDSSFDKLSPDYKAEKKVEKSEFINSVKSIKNSESISDYFKFEVLKQESGRVKALDFGKTEIEASKIRELFSLRSSSFDVHTEDENIVFTVYGYGHGVGMSQYGANCMAKNGSDFKEILLHYYKGCELTKTLSRTKASKEQV